MADHPIIFSGPMVQALLAGRKTQTRRLAWREEPGFATPMFGDTPVRHSGRPSPWQKVTPGDRLWVRESGHLLREAYDSNPAQGDLYRDAGFQHTVDGAIVPARPYDASLSEWVDDCQRANRPSIHMPRWASRLTLIVEAVKIERLQDISHKDAEAEGVVTDEWLEWREAAANPPTIQTTTATISAMNPLAPMMPARSTRDASAHVGRSPCMVKTLGRRTRG